MTDTFGVADVGNTRIKVGLCRPDGLIDAMAVPPEDRPAWDQAIRRTPTGQWTIAGVHPERRDHFADWLRERGHQVRVLTDYRDVPIRVDVEAPAKVGIDRLLNAVAVVPHIPLGRRAVVIDAGSAVTVDLVEREGVFRGGAIFPGLRSMAQALHDYTAQLPLVSDFGGGALTVPGRNTSAAIAGGILSALCGGIERIIEEYELAFGALLIAVAGGDADKVLLLRHPPDIVNSWLTLDGIRRTALHTHE